MGEYFTDFSLRCGSWTGSFLSLSKAIVAYIILPLAFLAIIDGVGAQLAAAFAPTDGGINFGPIIEELAIYLDRYMLYSIPLVIFSIFVGYYPAGNYARIPFKFISSAYLAILLLMFTDGGHLSIVLDGESLGMPDLAGIDLNLDIVAVIYILAIISFVKGFLAFTEFSDSRKKYLESLADKFNDKDDRTSSKYRKGFEGDFDEDDEPRSKRSRRRDHEYDEDDEPPRRRRRRDDYDDDDYDDDYDDPPKRRRR